ncbi:1,4-dihydroxy-2-naphthoate octaprenyltransferase [Aureisphaera galaxeae]|uniref:1,4-dihydroxy-2-naphthoate octaprenyltransferase n=1 Tax=Aureisphaera galaxeae TaxID=1538023 RepID=UPI002350456A|nr:1,4-dihydroxy-2-naphthoate octaprenyltransferase [Aureisphaera galaxeae]MDC8004881.1 1,4-dihydroxy-2-naphthoate octaprenyltransferase [Aureisphaera galaxeae]
MSQLKAWLGAARLRTLPLSVSGIIVGAALGNPILNVLEAKWLEESAGGIACTVYDYYFERPLFWFAILTTIGFQVLSNFANDYGDGVKGTDTHREGEKRMVASGIISPKQMKKGMYITAGITLLIASMLIFMAFGNENFLLAFIFFNLAIAAVIAAIKYTVGKSAYGYSGKGDIFVFLFFGLLSVLGTYFLFAHSLKWDLLLPATSIGVFSAAVLNLNNMRDIENDAKVGKNTLVVKWGSQKAKKYHYFLLILGMTTALLYTLLHYEKPLQFIYALAFIPFILNMVTVGKNKEPRLLDAELKKVALSTFAFAILFSAFH